ncbi:thiamine pyrophosphate-requiring protein [Novipirellula rosea]|uniref:Thiamine pyrophosphate-requiring protein n=1 Tax=Novipirellula rosea TaxID=1031540 RepID=A0ABP8NJE3_9BACT
MSKTVSDFVFERLHEWKVDRIYGFPGDGANGLFTAMDRAMDKFDLVRVSHEEMAAFMACAHSKFTGDVGVCMATSGPGAIHLLNGLYDAKMDHQSVVAIVGQQARMALGGTFQQEVDLISLFKDVAGDYVHMCSEPAQIKHLIDRAVRVALSQRCVTCVIIPNDVQELDFAEPPRVHGCTASGVGYLAPRVVPFAGHLEEAAKILNAGQKVAMLVGAGALRASAEVAQVAELLGAGVAKALLGKAVLPDEIPGVTGSIGLLGTKPSWDLMQDCDTLLMVGSGFPYSEFLPKPGSVKAVQIDIDPKMLSIRYPMDVPLVGDARETLRELIPLLQRKEDRSWRETIETNVKDWWEVLDGRSKNEGKPINPQRVFTELSPRLPDNCIITSDSGSAANWYARDIKIREGMMGTLSGNLATMCPGVPYAIAAKFCWPDRPAIALVGDGAMEMLGINGLVTISRYWKDWSDPRLIILVLNNHDLNQVTWEMRVMSGCKKFEASQYVPDFPFASYAESLGLAGYRVDDPEKVGETWDRALAADRPVVVEAVTDPEIACLPPHITLDQAVNFMSSIAHGDPNRLAMIKRAFNETVESFIPHGDE